MTFHKVSSVLGVIDTYGNMFYIAKLEQENIPVGCVPPDFVVPRGYPPHTHPHPDTLPLPLEVVKSEVQNNFFKFSMKSFHWGGGLL